MPFHPARSREHILAFLRSGELPSPQLIGSIGHAIHQIDEHIANLQRQVFELQKEIEALQDLRALEVASVAAVQRLPLEVLTEVVIAYNALHESWDTLAAGGKALAISQVSYQWRRASMDARLWSTLILANQKQTDPWTDLVVERSRNSSLNILFRPGADVDTTLLSKIYREVGRWHSCHLAWPVLFQLWELADSPLLLPKVKHLSAPFLASDLQKIRAPNVTELEILGAPFFPDYLDLASAKVVHFTCDQHSILRTLPTKLPYLQSLTLHSSPWVSDSAGTVPVPSSVRHITICGDVSGMLNDFEALPPLESFTMLSSPHANPSDSLQVAVLELFQRSPSATTCLTYLRINHQSTYYIFLYQLLSILPSLTTLDLNIDSDPASYLHLLGNPTDSQSVDDFSRPLIAPRLASLILAFSSFRRCGNLEQVIFVRRGVLRHLTLRCSVIRSIAGTLGNSLSLLCETVGVFLEQYHPMEY
ncbi:hypothetical protein DL96DRAFT_1600430 [Flagelloscypha sp. PMI_526]|nr:hypothetical protein DL96DRAFT_1600430 [Flagelloscypha sp. PMI_526]